MRRSALNPGKGRRSTQSLSYDNFANRSYSGGSLPPKHQSNHVEKWKVLPYNGERGSVILRLLLPSLLPDESLSACLGYNRACGSESALKVERCGKFATCEHIGDRREVR